MGAEFVKQRRQELGITQAELSRRLAQFGQPGSINRISHWEAGRNRLPTEKPEFSRALAAALEMDVSDLLTSVGYYKTEALIADLPPQVQKHSQEIERFSLTQEASYNERVPAFIDIDAANMIFHTVLDVATASFSNYERLDGEIIQRVLKSLASISRSTWENRQQDVLTIAMANYEALLEEDKRHQ